MTNLPIGVTLRDIDPQPTCAECGHEFTPKEDEDLCPRCQEKFDDDDER